ncbi:MAG: hypothetical protein M3Q12_13885 [Pseudomonadota bacterium]|nr:hypothetical protein [Polaromonas sp.]MDQ3273235.1 hypothetical protein [Pseudomonadota bacterium]
MAHGSAQYVALVLNRLGFPWSCRCRDVRLALQSPVNRREVGRCFVEHFLEAFDDKVSLQALLLLFA